MTGKKRNKTAFRRWHRRLGLTASILLLNLAITGIVLNHYQDLELEKHYIQSSWLLSWYGVEKPQEIYCLEQNNNSICQSGEFIFLIDSTKELTTIAANSGRLISLFSSHSEPLLVTQQQVFLYTADFQLIESLSISEQLSEVIHSASFSNKRLLLNTNKQAWILNLDSFELSKNLDAASQSSDQISYQTSVQPKLIEDSELKNQLALAYQQRQISYLKLVQDIHSGQILSLSGKLLADLAALSMILLAISGFIMWKKKNNGGSSK